MKLSRILQVAFILASAIFVYSFVATAQDGELRKSCISLCAMRPNYVGENRLAPDIRLKDINGAEHRLASLRGKTVVLVFWTTSCTVCKQQMPALGELAEVVKDDSRFAMLTVAVDENKDAVRQMVEQTTQRRDPFPVLLDPESEVVAGRFGTRLFPETWIIDPDGVIRARFDGARDWSSTVAYDVLDSVSKGQSCPLELQGGMAIGRGAQLCERAASPND